MKAAWIAAALIFGATQAGMADIMPGRSVEALCHNAADQAVAEPVHAERAAAFTALPVVREILQGIVADPAGGRVPCAMTTFQQRVLDAGISQTEMRDGVTAMLRSGMISQGRMWQLVGYDDCACLRASGLE